MLEESLDGIILLRRRYHQWHEPGGWLHLLPAAKYYFGGRQSADLFSVLEADDGSVCSCDQ
jgi:hypothetical protein